MSVRNHSIRNYTALRTQFLTTTALGLLLIAPSGHSALAQSSTPNQSATVDEIVVTGSRVIRDGYQAPTPVSVLSAEDMNLTPRANIAEYINQLPSIAQSTSPSNSRSTVSETGAGVNALNLRSMGINRTLVLLDGQRAVPVNLLGWVDVNNFPQGLVSRVDVVTGGASAAYGSDAMTGVVNFVLDKEFTGIKGEVSGGVTTYGDNRDWKVQLTGGTSFANDRGHFLISGEAGKVDGILINNRPWAYDGCHGMLNPAYVAGNGAPQYLVRCGTSTVNTPGGIITAGPLKGTAFGPGGTPYQFNYGQVGGSWMIGGDWKSNSVLHTAALYLPDTFQKLYTRASYDITDRIKAHVSWSYNDNRVFTNVSTFFNNGNITIKADNAYIPASVRARLTALGLTQFTMGSTNVDFPNRSQATRRIVSRYVVGLDGTFDAFDTEWTWDGYWQKGVTRAGEDWPGVPNTVRIALAQDAVVSPTTGAIVCRSTLTAPTNGCVPINRMGIGVASQAALNYVTAPVQHRNTTLVQDVYAASVTGNPVSTWAGPVSLAFGIERREESIFATVPPEIIAGSYQLGNVTGIDGGYAVTEGFVETVVPLAKDTTWARSLELNGAVRMTGYEFSGYVTTWKVGATYAPIDDIRFRFTQSRDIRAPSLGDLFATGVSQNQGVLDPFNGNVTAQPRFITSGNINLKPEKADTTGVGVVLQPRFIPGFTASVDYYNIKIKDSIGSVSAQFVMDNCFAGRQQFCAAIDRVTPVAGASFTIYAQPFNYVTEIASGFDIETSYRFNMDELVSDWTGSLTTRVLATLYTKKYSDNGVDTPVDYVGSHQGFVGAQAFVGVPSWRLFAQVSYANGPVTVGVAMRATSADKLVNSAVVCTSGCPASTIANNTVDFNDMPSATYFDASITYKFPTETDIEGFFGVKNITNKDPTLRPVGPAGNPQGTPTYDGALYDTLGRTFRAGVRFKM